MGELIVSIFDKNLILQCKGREEEREREVWSGRNI